MIIKAKENTQTDYYIIIKKGIFENLLSCFVCNDVYEIKAELPKHTKYSIANVMKNLKAKNYIITFEKG